MADGTRRASEAIEHLRTDVHALQDVATLRFSRQDVDSNDPNRTVAENLLSRAEKITEMGIQETMQSVLRSLDVRLNRFVETVGQVEQTVRNVQEESELGLTEMRTKLLQSEAKVSDIAASVSKAKAAQGTAKETLHGHTLQLDTLAASVAHAEKIGKTKHEQHESQLSSIAAQLKRIADQQDRQEGMLQSVVGRVEGIEKTLATRLSSVEARTTELDQYNVEFLELSKRSTSTFEGEIDARLSTLDTRYAALLKHYHATVMAQVASTQEGIEAKSRNFHAAIEGDVARISDEVAACTASGHAHAEKVAHEMKTLNRRLLQGLRLLKEHSSDGLDKLGGTLPQTGPPFTSPSMTAAAPPTERASYIPQPNFDSQLSNASAFVTPVAARAGGGGGGGGGAGSRFLSDPLYSPGKTAGSSPNARELRRQQLQKERQEPRHDPHTTERSLLGGPTTQVCRGVYARLHSLLHTGRRVSEGSRDNSRPLAILYTIFGSVSHCKLNTTQTTEI